MPECAFNGLLEFIQEKYGKLSQAQIAHKLGLKQPQISSYQSEAPERLGWWQAITKKIYNLGYKDGQQDANSKIMNAIIATFGDDIPQADLAKSLRMSQPAVSNWLNGSSTSCEHSG